MKIALLHPQCSVQGGAIKMALMTAQALKKQDHEVILFTFEHSFDCFPELQKGLQIEVFESRKKEKVKRKKGGSINNFQSIILHFTFYILPYRIGKIATLSWHLRHFDIIIANNPPMQIVAALTKVFSYFFGGKKEKRKKGKSMEYTIKSSLFRSLTVSLFPCTLSTNLRTIWWHHHIPWYLKKEQRAKSKQQNDGIFLKRFFEKFFIIPCIDEMIVTSHFVAESIRDYCGRDAQVIHPVLERSINPGVIVAPTPGLPGPGLHLFTHGRLEPGKGIDTIVRVWKALQAAYPIDPLAISSPVRLSSRLEALKGALVTLTIFGTGSLEQELRDQGIEVRPFDGVRTFESLKSGLSLGLYCSTIDAFGLSPLEAQDAGLSTIILDKGGARETLLSTMSGESVGYLVETVEELFSTAKYFCEHKKFPKPLSNVNYFHTRDYFSEERLSGDLLLLISKTK